MTADLILEDERLVLRGATAVHVEGRLEVPGTAEIVDLQALRLGAERVFVIGERLAGVPALPRLPAAPIRRPPGPRRPPVAIDLPPEHAAFVDDGRLDLVAYLHYLHRHVAWLHARLAALEP